MILNVLTLFPRHSPKPHDIGPLHPSLPYLPRPVVPILRGPSASIVPVWRSPRIRTLSLQFTCSCLTAAHAPSRRLFPEDELPIDPNTSSLPTLSSVIFCRQCVLDLHTSDKRAFYPVISLVIPSLLTPSITVFPPSAFRFWQDWFSIEA